MSTKKLIGLLAAAVGVSVLLISLSWWLLPKPTSNYMIPGFMILFLAFMYSSRYYHRNKLLKPSVYLYPVFVALSVSFGLISLMFGLHTDVFIAYDKTEDLKGDKFKWFKMDTILSFPKDQLKNKENVPPAEIDFAKSKDTLNTCHILIIDKTSSIGNSDDLINSYLARSASKLFSFSDSDIKSATTSDLVGLFIISSVYNNTINHSDEALCVFIYDGTRNNFDNISNDGRGYTFQASKLEEERFLEKYFSHMEKYRKMPVDKSRQRTSLNEVLAILKGKLDSVEHLKRNVAKQNTKFDRYKLSIVSDFVNSNLNERSDDISKVVNVHELYTYTLEGKEKKNNPYTSEMLIADMIKNFRHSRENVNIRLNRVEQLQLMYDELKFSNFKKYNYANQEALDFHYPYVSFNSNQASECKISFKNFKNNSKGGEFFIKIVDIDDPGNKKQFTIKKDKGDAFEEAIGIGELHVLYLDSTDRLSIKFSNANAFANSRLIFEIGSCEDNKALAYSIAFLPGLPATTSYYLIACYCMFVFGTALTLILPNLFVLILIWKRRIIPKRPFIDFLCLSAPIVLGAVVLIHLIGLYVDIVPTCIAIILFLLLLFSLPSFYLGLRDFVQSNDNIFDSLDIFGPRDVPGNPIATGAAPAVPTAVAAAGGTGTP